MAEAASELIGWERALMAAEKVKERLRRATRARRGWCAIRGCRWQRRRRVGRSG